MSSLKVDIPASSNTVKVSIIDTGTRISNIRATAFMEPEIPPLIYMNGLPALCFLIEHPSGLKYTFDLGLRKDFDKLPPAYTARIKQGGWIARTNSDYPEMLESNGRKRSDITGIIWSHWHWDHTGNPSLFPPSTELVVGPGFSEHLLPAYPTDQGSKLDESYFKDRQMREIEFSENLNVAGFPAVDFFRDGSFYLLDAPGHAIGHLCALARTTSDSFIFMGADTCHHGGEFRPSRYAPLSSSIWQCPGDILEKVKEATQSPVSELRLDVPFFTVPNVPDGTGVAFSRSLALDTREKLIQVDSSDNILVVLAHDASVLEVVDFFPEPANDWKRKGWKDFARWKFLRDLET